MFTRPAHVYERVSDYEFRRFDYRKLEIRKILEHRTSFRVSFDLIHYEVC